MTKWILSQVLRVIKKLWCMVIFILSLPIAFILISIFPFYKIKFISLFSDRIGHYAMNTELLLCYLDEIRSTEKRVKYLFYTREAPICNEQLHKMWGRALPIFPFTVIAGQVDFCMMYVLGGRYKNEILKRFETAPGNVDMNGYLKKHPPHLSFINSELQRGEKLLLELGVPLRGKFVCLLVRDSAYLEKYFPENDWSYHVYRDSNIENFFKAALFLAKKGYFVIRMGKSVSRPFDVKHPNIIDYALHPLRSDFADVYLSSHCEFFISTSSGLDGIPEIFRKPVLFVNVMPLARELQYWYPGEFFIIKKIYDKRNSRFVPLNEVDHAANKECNSQKLFYQMGWAVIENTEDEILSAVFEMEDFVRNKNEKNNSNNPFHELLKTPLSFSMVSDRDLLRISPEKFYIRMCHQFWLENQTTVSQMKNS